MARDPGIFFQFSGKFPAGCGWKSPVFPVQPTNLPAGSVPVQPENMQAVTPVFSGDHPCSWLLWQTILNYAWDTFGIPVPKWFRISVWISLIRSEISGFFAIIFEEIDSVSGKVSNFLYIMKRLRGKKRQKKTEKEEKIQKKFKVKIKKY